jgi:hypothetical protein
MTEERQIGEGSEEVLEMVARMTPQWLAGFFDGDGHVSISRFKTAQMGKPYLRLKCTFTGTNLLTMTFIASKCGFGGPYWKKAAKYKSKVYELDICGKKAEPFLRMILPYVIIRRKQVELALEFASIMHVGSGCRPSEQVLERAIAIRNEISGLNGAGRMLVDMNTSDLQQ